MRTACAAMLSLLLAACGDDAAVRGDERGGAVAIGDEDFARVEHGELERGPLISGRLTTERQAIVRAQVGGPILEVRAEPGEPVTRGQLLARIDDAALADQRLSGRSAVSSAETAVRVASREADRLAALAEAGAVATQQVETARQAVRAAEAQLADARARLALAEEQVGRTRVRAPLTGVISARPVNAGDVVQPGAELFTIVDPSEIRLEGTIPAAELTDVDVGDPVRFEVTGYPDRTFEGQVARIRPSADPTTGQVRLAVTVPNTERDLVSGLLARGRVGVETERGQSLVTVVRDGRTVAVPVEIGLRDPLTEQVLVRSGLQPGEIVLLGAAQGLTPGTEVEVPPPAAPAS